MNKKKFPITNIGSVSLLMIFIVLCMVTFAALSLSTAAADYRSAKRLAEHTSGYSDACSRAEETLAKIDELLADSYRDSSDLRTYHRLVEENAESFENITIADEDSGRVISYQTDINDTQALLVKLRVLYPRPAGSADSGFYEIAAWQEIHTTEWTGDNSIHLIEID